MKNGYLYAERGSGLGHRDKRKSRREVSVRQRRTGRTQKYNGGWGEIRKRDGTIIKQ